MFSKTLFATAFLLLGLGLQVHGHAAIAPMLGVKGNPTRNDVQRPSGNTPCGSINIANNIDTSMPVIAAANGSFATTITNFNGGKDGSRQVTAKVDQSGTGKNFTAATVTQNGDLAPPTTGSQQIVAQLPAGAKCTGGKTKDLCLASFTTAGGFGNCVVVKQAGGAKKCPQAVGSRAARAYRDEAH